jgi:hypothetical protein
MQNDTTGTRRVEADAKNDGTLMSCTCQLILKIFKKYVLINSLSYKKKWSPPVDRAREVA